MPTLLTWYDIGLRLLLTVVSAGLIGLERGERGRSAGLRTNLLVSLAACLAMIQTNALINSHGKSPDSFVVMDTMRLPLGILSGIGFIGAGAILKRGELVVGLTTAATLWFVTVMGLCYGGGQLGLGLAAFVLGIAVLWGLRQFEASLHRDRTATLRVSVALDGPRHEDIEAALKRSGLSLTDASLSYEKAPSSIKIFGWKLHWRGEYDKSDTPRAVQELADRDDIRRVEFIP